MVYGVLLFLVIAIYLLLPLYIRKRALAFYQETGSQHDSFRLMGNINRKFKIFQFVIVFFGWLFVDYLFNDMFSTEFRVVIQIGILYLLIMIVVFTYSNLNQVTIYQIYGKIYHLKAMIRYILNMTNNLVTNEILQIFSITGFLLYMFNQSSGFLFMFIISTLILVAFNVLYPYVNILIFKAKHYDDDKIKYLNEIVKKYGLRPFKYYLFESDLQYKNSITVGKRIFLISKEYLELPMTHLEMDTYISIGMTLSKAFLLKVYQYGYILICLIPMTFLIGILRSFDVNGIVTLFVFYVLYIFLILLYQNKIRTAIVKRMEDKAYRFILKQGFSKEDIIKNFVDTYKFMMDSNSDDVILPTSLQKRIDEVLELSLN